MINTITNTIASILLKVKELNSSIQTNYLRLTKVQIVISRYASMKNLIRLFQ